MTQLATGACPDFGDLASLNAAGRFDGFNVFGADVQQRLTQVLCTATPTYDVPCVASNGTGYAESSEYGSAWEWGDVNRGFGYVPTAFTQYATSADIYLDVDKAWDADTLFDLSSAINKATGAVDNSGHLADFVFNAGWYPASDVDGGPGSGQNRFLIGASTSSQSTLAGDPIHPGRVKTDANRIAITQSGWYRFKHRFFSNGGQIAAQMTIVGPLDNSPTTQGDWTVTVPGSTGLIANVGANRYGWIATNEFTTGSTALGSNNVQGVLAIDNLLLEGSPGAPTITASSTADLNTNLGTISVSITGLPSGDGGSPITSYTVTCGTSVSDPIAAGTLPIVVNDLFVNQPINAIVNCTATASNAYGPGLSSNSVAVFVPSLAINGPLSQLEGNSGTAPLVFTVSRSGGTAVVSVNYSVTAGTASPYSDYTPVTGSLTFTAGGANTKTISVPIIGDTSAELDETFSVVLAGVSGGTISTGTGVGTITNDDAVTVSIHSPSITEGNSGTSTLNFTVARTGPSQNNVTFNYAIAGGGTATGGTCAGGADYVIPLSGTSGTILASPASSATTTIPVTICGDTDVETNETIKIQLSGVVNGTLSGSGLGTGTINNDDQAPSMSIQNNVLNAFEGTTATCPVTLNKVSSQTITFQYVTTSASSTSTPNVDYTAVTTLTTVTFNPGDTVKNINVPILNDGVSPEAQEFFRVAIYNAVNATIANQTCTVTIPAN